MTKLAVRWELVIYLFGLELSCSFTINYMIYEILSNWIKLENFPKLPVVLSFNPQLTALKVCSN